MRRLLVLVVLVAGCGGSKVAAPVNPRATAAPTATPVLTGAAKCGEATCSTLRVPLDRARPDGEMLALKVAVEGPTDAPVFVFLSGGPGEPGVPFLARARKWLGPVAKRVRIVAVDQRGTGADALDCPALQREMGASDLSPPTQDAVTSCASKVGEKRQFFTTADTVDDLEALRVALGADKLMLDGISYGTYVAQRYALAYPQRVKALVLDSVVPAEGVSLLTLTQMQATRRVLGPERTKALAKVVKDQGNGPELLDLLTSLSVGKPRDDGYLKAIDAASKGDDASLKRWIAGVGKYVHGWTAKQLSQGLHASTLCADSPGPWGDAATPLEGRQKALDDAAAKLTDADLYPYDRETATKNGFALQCLYWPPVAVPKPDGPRDLPDVPTLLLNGDRDLSTPYEWAQQAVKHAPGGTLMIVKGAGHDVQDQGDRKALAAVRRLVASPG
ncbi:alpha/beta hydrolase [Solirubrobacter ginsenosidimutans]|uniref:Alpha/beta hydrolase n=1 Tax=Solirubrobacter ginsenosidimutans TaxID=490573 RepID=A0A9X3MW36_9ACTN|nr:alpha/beta hydrolase [Solirubrobacter ginsenosidimutans]MDA0162408.1 alpha/beta hydrolase [Solirubrobacter ginsenosidimutans]